MEFEYYRQLAKTEKSFLKKIYFLIESKRLKKYENAISNKATFLTVAQKDKQIYQALFGADKIYYLPVFIPYKNIISLEGNGLYCLYHANLSVPENERAAGWLVNNVFAKVKIPFIIAGKNPSKQLKKLVHLHRHISLVSNPSDLEMNDLVKKAHINILPSFTDTGIKLKLLHALFEGRHCVVNDKMINNTGVETACHIAENADAFTSIITRLFHQPFTKEEITLRKKLLGNIYNNTENARRIIQWLY